MLCAFLANLSGSALDVRFQELQKRKRIEEDHLRLASPYCATWLVPRSGWNVSSNIEDESVRPRTDLSFRYGVALSIKQAYATGIIGKAFDCADNSGSVS